jgi:hypothetical protein
MCWPYPDKPWNWDALSSNPNITFDNVLAYPDKPWNWDALSSNPNITFDNVLAYPDKPMGLALNELESKYYIR